MGPVKVRLQAGVSSESGHRLGVMGTRGRAGGGGVGFVIVDGQVAGVGTATSRL
jgi:hypothetical protein